MNRLRWIGMWVGAAIGGVGFLVLMSFDTDAYPATDGLANAVLGMQDMLTFRGDAPGVGFVLCAVVGGVVGWLIGRDQDRTRQRRAEQHDKSASAPHPMD